MLPIIVVVRIVAAQPIADGRPVGAACLVGAVRASLARNALAITTQLAAHGRGGSGRLVRSLAAE